MAKATTVESQTALSGSVADLAVELSSLTDEIKSTESQLNSIRKKDIEQLKIDAEALKATIQKIIAASCDSAVWASLKSQFSSDHESVDMQTTSSSPFGNIDTSTDQCTVFKGQVQDVGIAGLDRWVGSEQRNVQNTVKLYDAYSRYKSALDKRRSQVISKMREIEQRQNLTQNFSLFILLFGGLALGAMFLVSRSFSDEMQMEWVASGQITQFVTVMILLTVITMLGLSNSLNGETLGTLLGGVAGYVLAQGVGKAAARQAVKSVTTNSTDQTG